ncbi:MAG TPA: isochorismatase family protein [archaeon]|nr:isochorismatase family protein [archaeon]
MKDALVVVDLQVDFCAGGALAAHDTESVIDQINGLISEYISANRLVIFTRDWHPGNHSSFRAQGGPWPPHCVAGTPGAAFHPRLKIPPCHLVVSKAVSADKEAYSGFEGTGLAPLLKGLGIRSVALCGIATEYCVLSTFKDALRLGFIALVHRRAIRPVAPGSPEEKEALEKFRSAGALED